MRQNNKQIYTFAVKGPDDRLIYAGSITTEFALAFAELDLDLDYTNMLLKKYSSIVTLKTEEDVRRVEDLMVIYSLANL